jgi:DnaJ domain
MQVIAEDIAELKSAITDNTPPSLGTASSTSEGPQLPRPESQEADGSKTPHETGDSDNRKTDSTPSSGTATPASRNPQSNSSTRPTGGVHNINESTNTENLSLHEAYRLLGVSDSDNLRQIKRAYLDLSLMYHPDKFTSDSAITREITEERFKWVDAAFKRIKASRTTP